MVGDPSSMFVLLFASELVLGFLLRPGRMTKRAEGGCGVAEVDADAEGDAYKGGQGDAVGVAFALSPVTAIASVRNGVLLFELSSAGSLQSGVACACSDATTR